MKKNCKNIMFSIVLGAALFGSFQNCSPVKMTAIDEAASTALGGEGDPTAADTSRDNLGLKGGHFDFDTSSQIYDFNEGETDRHIHEYDNKFDVRSVDLFNMLDRELTKIPANVRPTQEFIITVANAENSQGTLLNINGTLISVVEYQKKVDQYIAGNYSALQTYNLGTLKDFKIEFSSDTISEAILVPIYYKCPIANKPSATGQYRNGALVIELLDKSIAKLNAKTRVATKDGGLLWEAFIFWHRDSKCR